MGCFLLWLIPIALIGQHNIMDEIDERFNMQLEAYPQEKIHLHTDRNYYVPGEKIWFKAYVIDAVTHQFPTFSRYVYVELISPADTLVNRVMIRQTDDMFYGHLPIAEVIPEGNYTLRAYTRYMDNLGDDYFFKKNIRIGNLSSNMSSKSQSSPKSPLSKNIKNTQTARDDFDVTFFPEGGNPVEGSLCKIAFKAINKSGSSAIITGKLIDNAGIEITDVKTLHAGMGMFVYTPMAGKRYMLKCRNENGLEKQFELPQTNPRAYTITASQRGTNLLIEVQRSTQAPDMPLYLLAHCRGMILHFAEWEKEKKAAVFSQDMFPAGVIQFVLFDGQMNPLSERLVFSKNGMSEKLEFQTDKEAYKIRDRITATLSPSHSGRAGVGLFSVAVTDDKDVEVDESTTILSSLLLSSELKGYIENPAYYLQDNPASNAALDLLMMTHGWRRYNIPEVAKGNPESPKIPFQEGQVISGQVKSLLLARPVADSEVLIMAEDVGVEVASSDRDGLFVFADLEFPDSTSFFIQALNSRGRDNVQITVNNESFPKPVYAQQNPTFVETDNVPSLQTNTFIEKAELRAKYDEDMQVIYLDEVVVTAKRTEKNDPRLRFWANEYSNTTISRTEIERFNMVYVSDYLRLTSGVMVNPDGRVFIRSFGANNRAGGGLPLVFIDGVEHYWPDKMDHPSQSPLEHVTVNVIESIDVFKGFSAAMFGMRGANGAISITTKRGENVPLVEKPNLTVYTPLGYQKPIEFYAPKYETLEARQSLLPDYRTTIFWKPDIVISEETEGTTFEFYTSDFPTTYSVVIEGLTLEGQIVRQVEKIKVE